MDVKHIVQWELLVVVKTVISHFSFSLHYDPITKIFKTDVE